MKLVDLTTVAGRLGVSVITIRRMVKRGDLTAYRVGPKLIRVDLNEVETKLARIIPTAGAE